MKKILVRSGMTPWDKFDAEKVLLNNSYGNNVGNLVYAYSIFRNLTTEETELVSDYYEKDPNNAEMINEKYDAYIFPLANAFRPTFIPTLVQYTKLIKRLTIPVYVIGIGLNAPYEANIEKGFAFDKEVKAFVEAVLEKSSIIGLRGQITADYLSYLGFKEGVDHQVIGCPSMYTYGNNIKTRKLKLNKNTRIATNLTPKADIQIMDFIHGIHKEYKNTLFVPQDNDELLLGYSGAASFGGATVNLENTSYPSELSSYEYEKGKVGFFLSAHSWLKHMENIDLSIGTRLHGNVVPTLSGVPSITIPIDARMKELTEFHGFAHISPNDISKYSSLEELIQDVDFGSVERKHGANFENFLNFLEKNGIEHIYDKNGVEGFIHPFDKKMENVDLPKYVESLAVEKDSKKIIERVNSGLKIAVRRNKAIASNNIKIIKKKNSTIKMLREQNNKGNTKHTDAKLISELKSKIELQEKIIKKIID